MAVAYSYVRFSTPDQAGGDSLQRQRKAAAAYAALHDLTLDESYRDPGVSAHRGKHVAKGALGRFVRAVEEGRIAPGSVLILEAFDRFLRQDVLSALELFGRLLRRNITIVTLEDSQTYSAESVAAGTAQIIVAVVKMQAAHEYSQRLGGRLRSAWAGKRDDLAVKKMTRWCPAWMFLRDDRSAYELIPERAAVVRLIFELYANGLGYDGVARELNARGTDTWEGVGERRKANGWSIGYVQRILKNPAAIGRFQASKKREVDGLRRDEKVGEAVPDYYPAAIPRDLWDRALAARAKRGDGKGGPGGTGGPKRPAAVGNLFTGLLRCMHCLGPMAHLSKPYSRKRAARLTPRDGIPPWAAGHYLVCSNAKRRVRGAGGGGAPGGPPLCHRREHLRYAPFERLALDAVSDVLLDAPLDADDAEADALRAQIGALRDAVADGREALDDMVLRAKGRPEVQASIARLEARLDGQNRRAAELEGRLAALRGARSPGDAQAAVKALRADTEHPDRAARLAARLRLAEALKALVDVAWVDARGGTSLVEYGGVFRAALDANRGLMAHERITPDAMADRAMALPDGDPRLGTFRAIFTRMRIEERPDGDFDLSFPGDDEAATAAAE